LLDPPGVKGWEEGLAWLNTSTMLHRSNLVGVLLGLVDASVFLDPSVVEPMRSAGPTAASQRLVDPAHSFSALEAKGSPGYVVILDAQLSGWKPDIDLCAVAKARGATSDAQIAAALADELLAVPLDPTTLDDLIAHLAQQRGMQSVDAAAFLDSPAAERTLRGLAHLMLSAPEAQFH
jgi:hypothetical protein